MTLTPRLEIKFRDSVYSDLAFVLSVQCKSKEQDELMRVL